MTYHLAEDGQFNWAEYATDTSLLLPTGLPRETWEQVGESLRRIEHSVMFWIADWAAYGERSYGELAAQTGVSPDTVLEAVRVGNRFPPERRRPDLSFSHHQAVAAMEPDAADALLAEAAERDMSVHHLREKVRQAKGEQRPEREEWFLLPTVEEEPMVGPFPSVPDALGWGVANGVEGSCRRARHPMAAKATAS